jgi:hypothetical protein
MAKKDPNSGKNKEKCDPYHIPDCVFSLLEEHTAGYLLCALDNEGNLIYQDHFDNDTISSAIRFKLLQILTVQHQAESKALRDQMLSPIINEDDDDEE